jgi:hypothetical protein
MDFFTNWIAPVLDRGRAVVLIPKGTAIADVRVRHPGSVKSAGDCAICRAEESRRHRKKRLAFGSKQSVYVRA